MTVCICRYIHTTALYYWPNTTGMTHLKIIGIRNTKCMELFQVLVQWRVLISATVGSLFLLLQNVFLWWACNQSNCLMQFGTDVIVVIIIILCYCCCVCFRYCCCYVLRLAMLCSHKLVPTRTTRTNRPTGVLEQRALITTHLRFKDLWTDSKISCSFSSLTFNRNMFCLEVGYSGSS